MNHLLYLKYLDQIKTKGINKLTVEDLSNKDIFDVVSREIYSQGDIKHFLKNSPIEFLDPIIYDMVQEDMVSIDDIPSVFLEQYDIATLYVEKDTVNMVMLPQHYKDDAEFIHSLTYTDGRVIAYATDRVKNLEAIIDSALKNNKKSFKFIPESLKTRQRCMTALIGDYPDFANNWQYVPEPLSLDIDFIKEIGEKTPKIYEFLDTSIKNIYEITQYFLNKDGSNLKHAPIEYKNDINLVEPILEKQAYFLQYAGDALKNNVDFILKVIKKTPYEIHVCGNEIKNNLEVAKYICNYHVAQPAISFFNEEIKANITVAMMSVLKQPEAMNYISKTLSNNSDFVLSYIEQAEFKPEALHYISNDLKNNKEVMIAAYDRNFNCREYIGSKLKSDQEFLKHIFSMPEGKNIAKKILLDNLKLINVKTGQEEILLSFCKHSGLDINVVDKKQILEQITDQNFLTTLLQQSDIYFYLKSGALMQKLEKELPQKIDKVKKVKI